MLENNNHKIITKMAVSSLKGSRQKFAVIIAAVMLSAFMLFSVLTVGTTYFQMQRIQNIHMHGADYDAALMGGFTARQKAFCKNHPDVLSAGVGAYAGYAEKTDADDTLHTSLIWNDDTSWGLQMRPAREKVRGYYPKKENELMVTKEALKDCGKENLDVGDSFQLTYADLKGSHTKTFLITGIWEGYGDQQVFGVSEAFYKKTGYQLGNMGVLYVKFKSRILSEREQLKFQEGLNLSSRQSFQVMGEMKKSVGILAGMAGLVLITCLSAYLLIYNILYLSVSRNIRYYGLMRTVGMTSKQICQYLQKQMLFVGAAGIGIGMLLGFASSFLIIPHVVRSLGIRESAIHISFHPFIFFVSVFITAVTIYLGSLKPVRTAVSVSPVEALGYQAASGKKDRRKPGRGNILWRMAKEQFGRDKKKTGIAVLSLAASLSICLCLITIVDSHGARTIVSNYMDTDLTVRNDTAMKDDEEEWKQIIKPSAVKKIRENEGVKGIHTMLGAKMELPWEPEFSDEWMRKFYEVWMYSSYKDDIEDYKKHPEKYGAVMVGIGDDEFDDLNENLEQPADKKQFQDGKICIIYRSGLQLDADKTKRVKYRLAAGQKTEISQMKIAGFTDDEYYGGFMGKGPAVIVSSRFLRQQVKAPYIIKLNIRYQKEYDEKTEAQIKKSLEQGTAAKDLSYDSKIENMKVTRKAQGNMTGVGAGIAVILALIGMTNYINTVFGNIQSRRVTLAVMESVGMTRRQVKSMLVREGLLFAASSLLITATAGLGATYLCYQSMNYMNIPFTVPWVPVLAAVLLSSAACIVIPLAAYRILEGKAVIAERVRGFE
ncbi:ABC transporter permease [Anaerostipes sp.]|uniref:ABC transporter permease n=1 Tax=Anaerostipes sp. TaxID=1872530 RepID=UPI0025B892C7|nr:ABC transporter permease [Anaerostipes sp.]MBS7008100.1 ABC transporter permease [Anaerostipes sp.]